MNDVVARLDFLVSGRSLITQVGSVLGCMILYAQAVNSKFVLESQTPKLCLLASLALDLGEIPTVTNES